jgi:predicted oxidoreductase
MIEKIKIAENGIEISEFVFGAWRLADDKTKTNPTEVLKKIQSCIDLGITSFDHADIYGDYSCERLFGEALKLNPSLKSKIQIITKTDICLVSEKKPHRVKHYNTSKEYIKSSLENSLKNLGMERIEILLLHRPDPLMDADETARALEELISEGKILRAGVSNFSVFEFQLLDSRMKNKLVTNQIEISISEMKSFVDGTIAQCQEKRIRPMAWSPTAGGKIFRDSDEKFTRINLKLKEIAKKYSVSEEEIAYAWLLKHPSGIIPIIGTNNMQRLEKIANSKNLKLDREDWFELWSASKNEEVP